MWSFIIGAVGCGTFIHGADGINSVAMARRSLLNSVHTISGSVKLPNRSVVRMFLGKDETFTKLKVYNEKTTTTPGIVHISKDSFYFSAPIEITNFKNSGVRYVTNMNIDTTSIAWCNLSKPSQTFAGSSMDTIQYVTKAYGIDISGMVSGCRSMVKTTKMVEGNTIYLYRDENQLYIHDDVNKLLTKIHPPTRYVFEMIAGAAIVGFAILSR